MECRWLPVRSFARRLGSPARGAFHSHRTLPAGSWPTVRRGPWPEPLIASRLDGLSVCRLELCPRIENGGDTPGMGRAITELHAPAQRERALDGAISAEHGGSGAVFDVAATARTQLNNHRRRHLSRGKLDDLDATNAHAAHDESPAARGVARVQQVLCGRCAGYGVQGSV